MKVLKTITVFMFLSGLVCFAEKTTSESLIKDGSFEKRGK